MFADDAVWWNGLPRIPGNVGQTEHKGIDAIRNIINQGAIVLLIVFAARLASL